MSGLVLSFATSTCWINYRNWCIGLLVLLLLPLLNSWLFVETYGYIWSSELAELFPLSHSHGMSTRFSNRLHDFLSRIRNGCLCELFLFSYRETHTGIFLPVECYSLIYYLNGFNFRVVDIFFSRFFLNQLFMKFHHS